MPSILTGVKLAVVYSISGTIGVEYVGYQTVFKDHLMHAMSRRGVSFVIKPLKAYGQGSKDVRIISKFQHGLSP